MATNAGVVNIHGKEYENVASRVQRFRADHPDYTIETQLISQDDEKVIMKALVSDGERLLATGYSEEVRASSKINMTSCLENSETSAIGRALAAFGYAGTEYASADEVAGAISQQNEKAVVQRYVNHADAFKRNWESIVSIKDHLLNDRLSAAWEEYQEIPDTDKEHLRVAPTKGAIWTLEDAKKMKKAQEDDFDPETGTYQSIAKRNEE